MFDQVDSYSIRRDYRPKEFIKLLFADILWTIALRGCGFFVKFIGLLRFIYLFGVGVTDLILWLKVFDLVRSCLRLLKARKVPFVTSMEPLLVGREYVRWHIPMLLTMEKAINKILTLIINFIY